MPEPKEYTLTADQQVLWVLALNSSQAAKNAVLMLCKATKNPTDLTKILLESLENSEDKA